jgi:integrase
VAAGARRAITHALSWAKPPAFVKALDRMPGLGALALRPVMLTALRSGEVRNARWSWLSFDGTPPLTVPGEAMKGKKSAEVMPHRVPLSAAALDTLVRAYTDATGTAVTVADLPRLAALRRDALIFPSAKRTTSLSAVMRRTNADRPKEAPAPWRDADGREAAEKALAHEVANKVSGAYRRSGLFDRRVPLMRDWAAHCTGAPAAAARARRIAGKGR